MALSFDSIYQPLNDFFVSRFGVDPRSPVLFRFDKFGSVIDDGDFIDAAHPELGYLPVKAIERFSDLVNHIPIDAGDGLNIVLSQNSIDTEYFYHFLEPASPYVPEGTNPEAKDAIVSAFEKLKGEARRVYDQVDSESMTGFMFDFKPSLATPERWYDRSAAGVWTTHSFQASEASGSAPPEASSHFQLWKLKVDDAAIQTTLGLSDAELLEPAKLYTTVVKQVPGLVPELGMDVTHRLHDRLGLRAAAMIRPPSANVLRELANVVRKPATTVRGLTSIGGATFARGVHARTFAVHERYLQRHAELPLSQRLVVSRYVAENAPTRPTHTESINVSFDYCVVTVERPWYFPAFVTDRSWFVPATAKGRLTSADTAGGLLALMPVGFVAVKNLTITADWSTVDIERSREATDFGPFRVGTEIVNRELRHDGIQIIGWLVEDMADLPPNDPP